MFVPVLLLLVAAEPARGEAFDRTIAPLFATHCLACHQGSEAKGGLDLSRRAGLTAGGESGAAVVAGKPDDSLLWQRVARDEMPPKKPLAAADRERLRTWIAQGAAWGTDPIDPFRFSTEHRAGADWWSLQPVRRPAPPRVDPAATRFAANPIDAFVLHRLTEAGLTPSPPAEPRVLVRRLSFDLLGLPPEEDEVERFAADPSEAAYRALVERFLASPHFGERWGRHWLDVVRYGESDGFERNFARKNAWRYRDWVIAALQHDLPYDQFARLQIAGDVLQPDADGVAAAGFLVAGLHNTVVGSSEPMKKLARQDEMEEIIGTLGQAFLGLTLHCARCHDHKFDPVPQPEYYRLVASLNGVNHGERDLPTMSVESTARVREIGATSARLTDELTALDEQARSAVRAARKSGAAPPPQPPRPLARWEFDTDLRDSLGELHGTAVGNARVQEGALVLDGQSYVATARLPRNLAEKTLEVWVEVSDLQQRGGAPLSVQTPDGAAFDAIVFGEQQPGRWMAGSDFFRRTKSFDVPEERETRVMHVAIAYHGDGTIRAYRDGQPYGRGYSGGPLVTFAGSQTQVLFGLRHAPAGGNRHFTGRVHRAQLYDHALSPEAVAASAGKGGDYVSEPELLAALDATQRARRASLVAELQRLRDERTKLESTQRAKVYTVVPGDPGRTFVLRRGDVALPGAAALPGAVSTFAGLPGDFGLPESAPDGERRRRLAEWLTDRRNPLFARVIVNRLWHHHFGTGLVETPSDLGFNGGRPSHPELLDWLAAELAEPSAPGVAPWSLKHVHRLIVTSATYRQSSAMNARARAIDAGNRLLWRHTPQRLDAESLRDALLFVSGSLNVKQGGPGFEDVRSDFNNGTTYYQPIDVDGPDFRRRTVYRFVPRGGRSTLLDAFDCPDSSSSTPRRNVTTTPLQALSLLNNRFVFRAAERFAARLGPAQDAPEVLVDRAFRSAFARPATADEVSAAVPFVREHGMPALARVLFNSSEFVVVE